MPERAGGGWYPPARGRSAPDMYAAWLDANGYDDSPQRRREFVRTVEDADASLADELRALLGGD